MIAEVKPTLRRRKVQPAPPEEFKVGDRVQVVCPEGFAPQDYAPAGSHGTILKVGVPIKGKYLVVLDGSKSKTIDEQRLSLIAPKTEQISLVSVGEGDRVRGKLARSKRTVEGIVQKLGTKYIQLDVGNISIESVEILERAKPPEKPEDQLTDLELTWRDFHPGDMVRQRSGKPFLYGQNKVWTAYVADVSIDVGVCYTPLHSHKFVHLKATERHPFEALELLERYDLDTQKHIPLMQFEPCDRILCVADGLSFFPKVEYVIADIEDNHCTLHTLYASSSKDYYRADAHEITRIGKADFNLLNPDTQKQIVRWRTDRKLTEMLKQHGFDRLGRSEDSDHADEDLESYGDWEIFDDGSVDLIHRPSEGWWSIASDQIPIVWENAAWAKKVIDAIEAKLGNEPEQTDLSTIAPNASLDDQISQTYQNLCQAEDTWHQAAKATVQLYFELGEQLNRRKAVTAHGEWGNCLVSFGIHSERAQRAMRIAKYFDGKSDRLTDLTLTQALDEIAQSKSQQVSLPVSLPALPQPQAEHDRPSNDFHPQETDGSESSPYTEFSAAQENPPAPEEKPVRTKRMPQPPPPICYWEQPEYLATVNPKECSIEIQGKAIAGQIVAVSMDWQLGTVKAAIVNHADGQVQLPMSKVILIQDIDMEVSE
jgi:hypothetical protein